MVDSHAIDLNSERKKPRLIYLGNVPRPYGINESDTWGMDHYMAAVLANGLRMLVAYGNAVRDVDEYERIASLLEFYSEDYGKALSENIDWSNDPDDTFDDLIEWLNAEDRSKWPGMNEYCEKSSIIDEIKEVYIREALDWLRDHWGELWD